MITIRKATADDLTAILGIYNQAVLNTTAVYDYEPHTMEMRLHWWQEKQVKGFPVLVAEISEEVVGFSTYGVFRPWSGFDRTVECAVYVEPSFQKKGIGRRLLEELIQCAMDAGLHAMVAGIDAENTASIGLHEKLGFKEVAHFKEVGFKFGRWLDLKFLQRLFN